MFTRLKNRIYLTVIFFALYDAASVLGRVIIGDVNGENIFVDSVKSISNEINNLNREILEGEGYLRETEAVVETVCHDFKYTVKTRLESTNLMQGTGQIDPVTKRFKRNDKASVSQNDSSKDYMSTYYAQRKAIMEKYKEQQKQITERLERTKSLIAETKKLKESEKTDSGVIEATRDESSEAPYHDSTIFQNATSRSVDFYQTTNHSTISNDAKNTNLNISRSYFSNSSDYESADYSTELDSPNTTLSPVYETLRPFANDKVEIIERPDLQTLEEDWPSESVNLIPQNEVDYNLTEETLVRQERDNDTVIYNLGGHLTNSAMTKNDSAFDQLERMFLWEEPRLNETDNSTSQNVNTISSNDRSKNSSQSSDSLRFLVEIKSSPDVQVTKNIKNVKSSTTTYRNSTHEIIEINGTVNSTRRINAVSPDIDLPNLTNPNVTTHGAEIGGGARESEWCEECPHDYRWGNCEGTLFYQHNIFLRNRGPSAIDAIFGMNVQGPVQITCVEAIRFNQTRGIVTLHSGGPGHDFAKLRIRGFQGEGFSYIMKVWGVTIADEFL